MLEKLPPKSIKVAAQINGRWAALMTTLPLCIAVIVRRSILPVLYILQRWENRPPVTMSDFDKKLAETDSYLQILIDQVQV